MSGEGGMLQMDQSNRSLFELFGILKSWIPSRSKPTNVSRDFWMPDHSCRVCYECDTKFTLFNRRHHCRLCGRIFCGKCTASSIPAPSNDLTNVKEEWEKIRVCNYCFKQWEQGIATRFTNSDNGAEGAEYDLSGSPSGGSFGSSVSSKTADRSTITIGSMSFSLGGSEQMPQNCSISSYQSAVVDPYQSTAMDGQVEEGSGSSNDSGVDMQDKSSNQFGMKIDRFEYEDDGYSDNIDSKEWVDEYYDQDEFEGFQDLCRSLNTLLPDGEKSNRKGFSSSMLHSYEPHDSFNFRDVKRGIGHNMGYEYEVSSSLCAAEDFDMEPVDFENNGLLWLPPEPENEDEQDVILFNDDDEGEATGEFGCLRTSGSFGSDDNYSRDNFTVDHKKAVNEIVDGHFRALVSQLQLAENISVSKDDDRENWLEIITSLCWEAAMILKPDMSRGGGMDPGGYVKVKCIASSCHYERMVTRIKKPCFMILGGALEYQRVSNFLASVDTLLKQAMDHLKMAVAKIDAQHPNVLLVEKSVSRFAQDYIL